MSKAKINNKEESQAIKPHLNVGTLGHGAYFDLDQAYKAFERRKIKYKSKIFHKCFCLVWDST
ncbi:hypothetical protein OC709_02640 ['Planchonia careya' phytoplasma]|nr:hypothetical protein ['Planchonia careya' phytoplasma]MDO8030382.1 hypothetical protein ['Planchonia careya' phytoplasma]